MTEYCEQCGAARRKLKFCGKCCYDYCESCIKLKCTGYSHEETGEMEV